LEQHNGTHNEALTMTTYSSNPRWRVNCRSDSQQIKHLKRVLIRRWN